VALWIRWPVKLAATSGLFLRRPSVARRIGGLWCRGQIWPVVGGGPWIRIHQGAFVLFLEVLNFINAAAILKRAREWILLIEKDYLQF